MWVLCPVLQNEIGKVPSISILWNSLGDRSVTWLPLRLSECSGGGGIRFSASLSVLSFCCNWSGSIFGLSLSPIWAVSVLLSIASDMTHFFFIHQADGCNTKLAEDLRRLRRNMLQHLPANNPKANMRRPLCSRLPWPSLKGPTTPPTPPPTTDWPRLSSSDPFPQAPLTSFPYIRQVDLASFSSQHRYTFTHSEIYFVLC